MATSPPVSGAVVLRGSTRAGTPAEDVAGAAQPDIATAANRPMARTAEVDVQVIGSMRPAQGNEAPRPRNTRA